MSHVSNATIVVGDCGFGRCDASAFDSCTGQATVGVAQGTATVVKKTGKGAWCIVTLGLAC